MLLSAMKAIWWKTLTKDCCTEHSVCFSLIRKIASCCSNGRPRRLHFRTCGRTHAARTLWVICWNSSRRTKLVKFPKSIRLGKGKKNVNEIKGARVAAQRKLQHELGIPPEQILLEKLHYLTRIHYLAPSDGMWGEHESKHLIGAYATSYSEN